MAVDVKTLESYSGTYKSEQAPLEVKAFVKDGKLFLQATGQPELGLKATSATHFEFAAAGIAVDFESPSSFTLRQGGRNIRFQKAVTH